MEVAFEFVKDTWDPEFMSKKEIIIEKDGRSAKRWEKFKRDNTYYSAQCKTKLDGKFEKSKMKWRVKTGEDNEEGTQYYIGLCRRQENFYEKIVSDKDSYFLDIFMGQTLCNGETAELYGYNEIVPDSVIDIMYDRDEGTLEFIVNEDSKDIKLQHDDLKKGTYYLTAMWMKDD